MAGYILNYLRHSKGIKLEPPGNLFVPMLRNYTFITVTGKITCSNVTRDLPDLPQLHAPEQDMSDFPGSRCKVQHDERHWIEKGSPTKRPRQ